jgi:hypothetical protein
MFGLLDLSQVGKEHNLISLYIYSTAEQLLISLYDMQQVNDATKDKLTVQFTTDWLFFLSLIFNILFCISCCFYYYDLLRKRKSNVPFTSHKNRSFDCWKEETCHLTVLYYVNLSVCINLIGTTLYMYRNVIEAHILNWTIHTRWSCPMSWWAHLFR